MGNLYVGYCRDPLRPPTEATASEGGNNGWVLDGTNNEMERYELKNNFFKNIRYHYLRAVFGAVRAIVVDIAVVVAVAAATAAAAAVTPFYFKFKNGFAETLTKAKLNI